MAVIATKRNEVAKVAESLRCRGRNSKSNLKPSFGEEGRWRSTTAFWILLYFPRRGPAGAGALGPAGAGAREPAGAGAEVYPCSVSSHVAAASDLNRMVASSCKCLTTKKPDLAVSPYLFASSRFIFKSMLPNASRTDATEACEMGNCCTSMANSRHQDATERVLAVGSERPADTSQ